MGLLSEAIRSHLELKRQHGADPRDVAHLEQAALGSPLTDAGPLDDISVEDRRGSDGFEVTRGSSDSNAHGRWRAERRPEPFGDDDLAEDHPGGSSPGDMVPVHAGQETIEIDMGAVFDHERTDADFSAFDWAAENDWSAGAVDPSFQVEWETPIHIRHAG